MNNNFSLKVQLVSSVDLARCTCRNTYHILSSRELSEAQINSLYEMGAFYGQSYSFKRMGRKVSEDGCSVHYLTVVTTTVDSSD
jgi:hypothetical protein